MKGCRGRVTTCWARVAVPLGLVILCGMAGSSAAESTIYACVDKKIGTVRIVASAGSCSQKESALQWNVQGPAGPPGVLGALEDLEGLPCNLPGGGTGTVMLLVVPGQVGAGLACGNGRYADLGPAVFDTQTKLLWEKKVPGMACLHCALDRYNWCWATGDNAAGTPCEGNLNSWIAEVNTEALGGFTDWRLPSPAELGEILDAGVSGCGAGEPCIDPIFGPAEPLPYWTNRERDTNFAYIINFYDGNASVAAKPIEHYVRAVRGGL